MRSTPPRASTERASVPPAALLGGYLAPVGKPEWAPVEEEDAPTIAGPMDPELSEALKQVRREGLGLQGAVAPPRVGPSPERPAAIPRVEPSASTLPLDAPNPQPRPVVVAKQSAPAPQLAAPMPQPTGDPRYSTVVIPGGPGQGSPERMKPAVFDADMMSDDRTQVDMPLPPPRAAMLAPALPPLTSQASPRGFAFIPAPQLPPELQRYDPGPQRGRIPSHIELFEAAPPPPVMPRALEVPREAFPGRRLSTHEDLRILVPEKSYALDHNPFAAALRRRQRIKVGILVSAAVLALGLLGVFISQAVR